MRNYIIRRCLIMVPLFVGITILSFFIISLSPVDIIDIQTSGNPGISPIQKQELKVEIGLSYAEYRTTRNGKAYWGTSGSSMVAGQEVSIIAATSFSPSALVPGNSLLNETWQPDLLTADPGTGTGGESHTSGDISDDGEHAYVLIQYNLKELGDWRLHFPQLIVNVSAACNGGWHAYLGKNTSGIYSGLWTWEHQITEISNDSHSHEFRQPLLQNRLTDYLTTEDDVDSFNLLIVSRQAQNGSTPITLNVDLVKLQTKVYLTTPPWIQYFNWFFRFLLGQDISYIENRPVRDVVLTYAWETVKLGLASLLVTLIIAIPVGVISATKQYSPLDNAAMTAALLGISLPVFWTGLILILIFGYYIPILPYGGAYPLTGDPSNIIQYYIIDGTRHMILPTLILGTAGAALVTRLIRSSMLEVLRQDYVITARAKGLKEKTVVYKHALRNALIPVVTVVGLAIGGILAGAALTETVFNWPGLGRIGVAAAIQRDYYLVLGVNIIVSMMLIFVNLLTDISYAFLDPRIRY
ncbi:MAG: ABC transporter permease [Candidatus Hodarchaeota archaeon]